MRSELEQLERTTTNRPTALYFAARNLGNLVAGGEADRDYVAGRLIEAGISMGLPAGEARRHAERGLDRGEQTPRRPVKTGLEVARTATDARARTLAWQGAAHDDIPLGRRRGTTLKIIDGLASWSLEIGKTDFALSFRQLAERAGVNAATITRHLPELLRWVTIVGKRRGPWDATPTRWRLSTGRAFSNRSVDHAIGRSPLVAKCAPGHNYWFGSGTAREVALVLAGADQTVTAVEVATGLGVHPGTVRRHLRRLERDGLAVRDDDGGWSWAGTDLPDDGLVDHAAERKALHARDRVVYNARRAAWMAAAVPLAATPEIDDLNVLVDVIEPEEVAA